MYRPINPITYLQIWSTPDAIVQDKAIKLYQLNYITYRVLRYFQTYSFLDFVMRFLDSLNKKGLCVR